MRIADVLAIKGAAVITVASATTVTQLLDALAQHNIGAVLVSDGERLQGIVSERDVVRALHERGPATLNAPVHTIMADDVVTCAAQDTVDAVMTTMTERRIRHLPVMQDGSVIGIVSIGDVVKNHVAQLESDREQLESYIVQG
ncbi:MAG: CBS domain-containing protein [Sciscionella sp.]